jgi:hypothetical protein
LNSACGALIQLLIAANAIRTASSSAHDHGRILVQVSETKLNSRFLSCSLSSKSLLVAASGVVTMSSAWSLEAKEGLPFINQMYGWIILGKCTAIKGTKHRFTSLLSHFIALAIFKQKVNY